MKHFTIFTITFLFAIAQITRVLSQNTYAIKYNIANLNSFSCNVFALTTPPVINGLQHLPLCGGVNYNGSQLVLNTQYSTSSNSNMATAYAIQFPFKEGYNYTFAITAKGIDGSNSGNFPSVFTTLANALPDPTTSNPTACNAVPKTNWGFLLGYPALFFFQTNGTATTFNSNGTYTAPSNPPKYIFILAYGGGYFA